ncbi:SDR family NAD(P)-dependent oxidoreductase [Nannocystis radixulma]|uniref:SDR family NAD(P)-dependent oxidoreductase n=1 Tax=Nannocystis radixulma TaxID=2995305 RepID=A0ABT5AWH9_9BACT|nr:SDR family NAD(P)-dependent oxidoreductase [Nannocystis radixulma]MDC0666189.1 SDR family NAD(P)-dependent oxidoreductase [Nannocystis radixulma]
MKLAEAKGDWALVTGASSGIGQEFAIQLARAGLNVVLVARREERLQALARSVASEFGVRTEVIALDLSQHGAVEQVKAHLDGAGIQIRLLCNNAAAGRWGRIEATPAPVYQQMIELNTAVLVAMCHQFLPHLTAFPSSAVINVSSPASYQPVPYMAVYAATKAFVQSFSQALHGEWKERGILVQTLVPGPTESEFDAKAGAYESTLTRRGMPAEVVRASLVGLAEGSPVVVAAKGTYKQRVFAGLFPSKMVIREVGKMFKPPK